MTPEETKAYQRERNRRKQAAYRIRLKAKKLAELEHTEDQAGSSINKLTTSAASHHSATSASPPIRVDPYIESELGLLGFAPPSTSSNSAAVTAGASSRRTSASVASSSTSNITRPTSLSLFASLLNDSPSTPLLLNPRSTSFLPRKFDVDLLRQSLGLPSNPPSAGHLPSYSYNSSVDLDAPAAATDSSWKWSLFELHTTMTANRSHATDGYLYNPAARRTLNEAQLMIFRLMMLSSNKQDQFDRRRTLSEDDSLYLATARIDERVRLYPDPMFRVLISKMAKSGVVDLTELTGHSIECSRNLGDVWDAGGHFTPSSVHTKTGYTWGQTRFPSSLRGATAREIVLGLEEPHWRQVDHEWPLTEITVPYVLDELSVVYTVGRSTIESARLLSVE